MKMEGGRLWHILALIHLSWLHLDTIHEDSSIICDFLLVIIPISGMDVPGSIGFLIIITRNLLWLWEIILLCEPCPLAMYSRACHQESISEMTGHGVPIFVPTQQGQRRNRALMLSSTKQPSGIHKDGFWFGGFWNRAIVQENRPITRSNSLSRGLLCLPATLSDPLITRVSLLNEHVAKLDLAIAQRHCWTPPLSHPWYIKTNSFDANEYYSYSIGFLAIFCSFVFFEYTDATTRHQQKSNFIHSCFLS